ncbi:OmpA family protein [Aquirufa sp.]|jgi:outer membrane protein OmpA-like peptidoglycan-associated protein|uniref:OmpA family protein n=1 Tax=Aquirufa sp. TaxID=2676249 RepID=UPI003784601E
MKKYLYLFLFFCSFSGHAQDWKGYWTKTKTYSSKAVQSTKDFFYSEKSPRQNVAFLLGGSNMWLQNVATRRDFLVNYTHFGFQYARETADNTDVFTTVLFGVNGDGKAFGSAGLGMRYYLLDRASHNYRPFASFHGEMQADNSFNETNSDLDFAGAIGLGTDYKIKEQWFLRGMVNVGFPMIVSGTFNPLNGRGTFFSTTLGLVYEWGAKPKKVLRVVPETPLPPMDTDEDGIADIEDKCPTVKGVASNEGCPIVEPKVDTVVVVAAAPVVPVEPAAVPVAEPVAPAASVATPAAPVAPAAAPDTLAMASVVEPMPADSLFELNVYFATDKAHVGDGSRWRLNRIIRLLIKHPEVRLKVVGHTDARASIEHNEALSKRRVENVKRYLIKNGIDPKRLKPGEWKSEFEPIAPNTTDKKMQLNRRVEVRIWK